MQLVFKTKNSFCESKTQRIVNDMSKKFAGVLDFHSMYVNSNDHSKGMIVTINGHIDAQVIIGGVDGSYIHIWWMKNGENQFYDIDLSILTRIVQL